MGCKTAVICLIVGLIIFMTFNKKKDVAYMPIQLEKDGYWSFISENGEIKFKDEFKNKPSQIINGVFSVMEDGGYSLYRTDKDKFELIPGLENLTFAGHCNYNLIPVCFPEKRITIVNKDGKKQFELTPIKGKEIIATTSGFIEKKLLIMTEDYKYGFVNISGECIIQPEYDELSVFSNGNALALKDSIISIIDEHGRIILSFKKGLEPVNGLGLNYGKICMKDNCGRYYMYDTTGEKTNLSTKIQEVIDFNDKYVIFKSKSGDKGLMTISGEIIIRPKYSTLNFGSKDELLASRKDNEWEILDYKGNIKRTLNCQYLSYSNFGYIASDNNDNTIIRANGKPISQNSEFYKNSYDYCSGLGISQYIPKSEIIKAIIELITPIGIDKYKFGDSMKDIVISSNSKNIEICTNSVKVFEKDYRQYCITVAAWSSNYILPDPFIPIQNHESTIEAFFIVLGTRGKWRDGITDITEALKKVGFTESPRKGKNKDSELQLTNNDKSILVATTDHQYFTIEYSINLSK